MEISDQVWNASVHFVLNLNFRSSWCPVQLGTADSFEITYSISYPHPWSLAEEWITPPPKGLSPLWNHLFSCFVLPSATRRGEFSHITDSEMEICELVWYRGDLLPMLILFLSSLSKFK